MSEFIKAERHSLELPSLLRSPRPTTENTTGQQQVPRCTDQCEWG